jgi:hypothetical protein
MTRLEILCKATGQQGGTIHDFNRRYVCDFLTMSNKDFFKVIYAVYLTRCRQTMPDLYAWPIEETEAVAIRMCNAIDRGSFNKDGAATYIQSN